jgi:hypothetical protein
MPKGRERNITGEGKEIYKRGEDLGAGPVGKQDGYQGRPAGSIKPEAPQRPAQSQIKTPGPSTNKTGPQEKGETFRRGTDSETVRSFQSGQTQNRGSVPSRGLFGGKFFRYLKKRSVEGIIRRKILQISDHCSYHLFRHQLRFR